jgi:hypothetical protein
MPPLQSVIGDEKIEIGAARFDGIRRRHACSAAIADRYDQARPIWALVQRCCLAVRGAGSRCRS